MKMTTTRRLAVSALAALLSPVPGTDNYVPIAALAIGVLGGGGHVSIGTWYRALFLRWLLVCLASYAALWIAESALKARVPPSTSPKTGDRD